MTYQLSDFLETMQHEMDECTIVLTSQGYRLDGSNGLKTCLKILDVNQCAPKSCDYIQDWQSKLLFVEFSDLERQHQQQATVQQILQTAVNSTELRRCELNRVNRLLAFDQHIKHELHGKIVDTDFILRQIEDKRLLSQFLDLEQENHILVVWHERGGVDTARVLDAMLSNLKGQLSRANLRYLNYQNIHCLSLEQYNQKYG